MTEKIIKYGIMSAASIVPRFLAGLKESKNSSAWAVGASNLERAKAFATKYDIPHYYGSYEELVADPELDVIYIPLYNKAHYTGAKLALEHNKNVLLEKPFTLTEAQAKELFAIAAEHHVFLMEAQKAVFLPITNQVKAAIDENKIGDVQWVLAQSFHPGGVIAKWFNDLSAGGGSFIGSAPYPLDYLQYVLNEKFIYYDGQADHNGKEADRQAIASLKTNKGTLVSLFISSVLEINGNKMVIHGTKGEIEIPNYWKTDHAVIRTWNRKTTILRNPQQSEFVFEIDHVAKQLATNQLTSPIMTPQITLQTMHIIESLYKTWYPK